MKKTLAGAAVALAALTSLTVVQAAEPITPIPAVKVKNPKLVELGTMLYFEPRLSRSGFISCNSCHNLGTGGVDNTQDECG